MGHAHGAAIKHHVEAVVLLALLAVDTNSAGATWINCNPVSSFQGGYIGTHRRNLTSNLMAENHRFFQPNRTKAPMAIVMQVRPANASPPDCNGNLVRPGRRMFVLLNAEVEGPMNDDCFHACFETPVSVIAAP
jgi:hypothetical protein